MPNSEEEKEETIIEGIEDSFLEEAVNRMPVPVEGGKAPAGKFKGDIDQLPDGSIRPGRVMGGSKKQQFKGIRSAKRVIDEILTDSDNLDHLRASLLTEFYTDPIKFLLLFEHMFNKEEVIGSESKPLRIIHQVEPPSDRN